MSIPENIFDAIAQATEVTAIVDHDGTVRWNRASEEVTGAHVRAAHLIVVPDPANEGSFFVVKNRTGILCGGLLPKHVDDLVRSTSRNVLRVLQEEDLRALANTLRVLTMIGDQMVAVPPRIVDGFTTAELTTALHVVTVLCSTSTRALAAREKDAG